MSDHLMPSLDLQAIACATKPGPWCAAKWLLELPDVQTWRGACGEDGSVDLVKRRVCSVGGEDLQHIIIAGARLDEDLVEAGCR